MNVLSPYYERFQQNALKKYTENTAFVVKRCLRNNRTQLRCRNDIYMQGPAVQLQLAHKKNLWFGYLRRCKRWMKTVPFSMIRSSQHPSNFSTLHRYLNLTETVFFIGFFVSIPPPLNNSIEYFVYNDFFFHFFFSL